MDQKRKKLGKVDYRTFVDIFNTQGKTAAVKYVTDTYGVKYNTIIKRLSKESEYTYNHRRGKYESKSGIESESPFLSVEELCNTEKPKLHQTSCVESTEIILSLIKDKFFEISKYVTLESSSRKIILKLDAAKNAGYDIEYI